MPRRAVRHFDNERQLRGVVRLALTDSAPVVELTSAWAALSEKFVRGLGRTIREYIDGEIVKHVEPLKRELADVRKTSVRYRGTWQKAERDARGDALSAGTFSYCPLANGRTV